MSAGVVWVHQPGISSLLIKNAIVALRLLGTFVIIPTGRLALILLPLADTQRVKFTKTELFYPEQMFFILISSCAAGSWTEFTKTELSLS